MHCCPIPFADSDMDTDVDMVDFAALQRCLTIGSANPPTAECKCFDRNGDDVIDSNDVEVFILCGTGANVAFDPASPPQAACHTDRQTNAARSSARGLVLRGQTRTPSPVRVSRERGQHYSDGKDSAQGRLSRDRAPQQRDQFPAE